MLGFPGAGKTTASKLIHELTGAYHLWADHERRLKFATPTYTHQENTELYEVLNQKSKTLLENGQSVIFDTNFNFYKDRQHLRDIAASAGAETVLIWVHTPKEIAKTRATKDAHKQDTRVLGNMPEERFERMTGNLQPPKQDEAYIELDSTQLTSEYVKDKLSL